MFVDECRDFCDVVLAYVQILQQEFLHRIAFIFADMCACAWHYSDVMRVVFVSFCSPVCPADMDWSVLCPDFFKDSSKNSVTASAEVQFADIGCGYGGLLGNYGFVCKT